MRDIVIIGGGPVGLCAALALQHPARRVTVLEAADLEAPQAGGLNARSIALSASSVQILRALGLWAPLESRAAPIRHIHVSARGSWGVTRLDAGDYDLDALGYVIEFQPLCRILLDAAAASEQILLEQQAEFNAISQRDAVRVDYRKNGEARQLDARLALIADGAQSRARAALGIGAASVDYGQSVVISNVEVSRARADTAYERFTPQGPLAMLPLGGKTYASVWTLAPERAAAAAEQSDTEFVAALQDCFGYRLGRIERAGARASLPLKRIRAETLQRGACLLIGNAANALHPVAGQSFNLSLRDVACLYELLLERDLARLDSAAIAAIASSYEQLREAEQGRVIRYGDGLINLFSNNLPLFGQARAAGLGLLDLLPALKAQAAFAGMGFAFGGSRLLRGHL